MFCYHSLVVLSSSEQTYRLIHLHFSSLCLIKNPLSNVFRYKCILMGPRLEILKYHQAAGVHFWFTEKKEGEIFQFFCETDSQTQRILDLL